MAVIFPDVEAIIIPYLVDALSTWGTVRVGTKKLPPEAPEVGYEVVVLGNYDGTLDPVRARLSLTVDVYGIDYEQTSQLALLVAALITEAPSTFVKRATVILGPMRLEEPGVTEKRSMEAELIIKGSEL